ncbi:MAG: SPOR domain-containing protein [Candidatus Latescibacteria bacterium]|nr:SPOR domain-containing protein [Candidatus Latescibacterota bacterium]
MGALLLGGCAGNRQFQHPPGGAARGGDFDPASLREDLLLIQPTFDRPPVSPADTAAAEFQDLQAALSREALPLVYRLQIIAFKTEDLARQRAATLQTMLGVPVRVVAERGLFMVQAGEYKTAEEAEALGERLAALNPDYAEAYVIPRTGRGRSPAAGGVSETSTSFSGWRVLIDQFLTYEEAERLRQEAADRLQRTDVEIDFKAPWFKVEVGRFRSEATAQELVELIQSCGYRNVLKVREKIEVGRP